MRKIIFIWTLLLTALIRAVPGPAPAAMFLVLGDQHSAYERTAQVVARIDRWRAENPQVPLAILLDGDVFENGNVVARRSMGAIDFAMMAALAKRAPTVLNVGNHEPEFFDLNAAIERIRATGVLVVSNIGERSRQAPFVPPSTRLQLGPVAAVIVGLCTDRLATFRAAIRPSLDLADPVVWSKANLPELLGTAPVRIVLSHAGLNADREILPLVPDGTLFAGAHDHLRLVEKFGRTVYFQSGSWNTCLTFAALTVDERGQARWDVRQEKIAPTDPADPVLARLMRDIEQRHLTGEDTQEVGRLSRALDPDEAAHFVVQALRISSGADAALVSHTTFGGGLPGGGVSRAALASCVRFDSPILIGEMTGAQLEQVLAAANETPDTPFAQRRGDYLVAVGPAKIDPRRKYRFATTDWIAHNPQPYLGPGGYHFVEAPRLRLLGVAAGGLSPPVRQGRGTIILKRHEEP